METTVTTKFLFLEAIYRQLTSWGMGESGANFITFTVACVILFLLIWLLEIVFSRIFSTTLRAIIRHTNHSEWDYFLQKRNFYKRLVNLVASIIILATSRILFMGFSETWIKWAHYLIYIYIIFVVLKLLFSILNTINDVYETKPQSKIRSIRTYIQSAQIISTIIAFVLVIIVLLDESAGKWFAGLGAFAAVIALIFRDTILSFVASIQVSAQDMFRPGDWVEMPSRNANGQVEEINVMSIKIRNFDNSVSMIPTYAMISESFTNWRNMQESSGRRFKRPLFVDINSIKTIDEHELNKIASHPLMDSGLIKDMIELMNSTNTSTFMTNLGLYRSYIEVYLNSHQKINQNQLRVVRYLDNSENGITIQLYAFSIEKTLFEYEHIISDIFENIMAIMPVFGLKPYQRPISRAEKEDTFS